MFRKKTKKEWQMEVLYFKEVINHKIIKKVTHPAMKREVIFYMKRLVSFFNNEDGQKKLSEEYFFYATF